MFEINIDHLMTKIDLNDSYIFISYITVNTLLLLCEKLLSSWCIGK